MQLRTLNEQDRPFIYELMTSPLSGGRVRFGGATPSPEKVLASLWESVLAQFVLACAETGRPLGLIAVTSPNFRDGFAYLSALGAPESLGRGDIVEGALLGVHYAFLTWPFRKLYLEATEESYRSFRRGLGVFFTEEGRLREHTFWNGRYQDMLILSVYRETWAKLAPAMMEQLVVGPAADEPDPED